MQWQYLSSSTPQTETDLKQVLLENRHISDSKHFFTPLKPDKLSLKDVGFDQAQLDKALKRIETAIKSQEKVVLFGDYDADGICATAILWRALRAAGLETQPFIPLRDKHGYGLSEGALQELADSIHPDLIITVDNGIVAHQAVAFANTKKIDVIISDHHVPEKDGENREVYPPAYAIIHSTKLCGASIAWMLANMIASESAKKTLELAGLATISDQVPLQELNRSFAFHGVVALKKTSNVGLQALAEAAKVDLKKADSNTVGYVLAPRINAMGRLAHGIDALRLLCTDSIKSAQKLATLLAATNTDRQDMTMDQYNLALEQAEEQKTQAIIFVASEQFHEGVIGLIAGRLMERFAKPAIAVSITAGKAKGSARSVIGVNIIQLLREVREELLEVGGHPMAAGFGVTLDKIEVLKNRLFSLAEERIDKELLKRTLKLECILPLHLVTEKSVDLIEKFAPFGTGNPQPLFSISGFKLTSVATIGQEQKHLKLQLTSSTDENGTQPITALYWGNGELAEHLVLGDEVAVAAKLDVNEWRGKRSVQLVLQDLESA